MSVRSRCLYSNEQTAKGQIRVVVVVVVVVGLVSRLVHSLAACWANILQAGNVTPYTISSSRLIDTLQDNAHLVHAFAAFLHGISTMAIARFASPHYAPRFLLIRCSLVSGGGMPPPLLRYTHYPFTLSSLPARSSLSRRTELLLAAVAAVSVKSVNTPTTVGVTWKQSAIVFFF